MVRQKSGLSPKRGHPLYGLFCVDVLGLNPLVNSLESRKGDLKKWGESKSLDWMKCPLPFPQLEVKNEIKLIVTWWAEITGPRDKYRTWIFEGWQGDSDRCVVRLETCCHHQPQILSSQATSILVLHHHVVVLTQDLDHICRICNS